MPSTNDVDSLLVAVKKLSPSELDEFTRRFSKWRRQENVSGENDDHDVEELIQQAKLTLPQSDALRLEELSHQSECGNLSDDELSEYRRLTKRAQQIDAARVTALAELVRLWGRPAGDVMKDLGWEEHAHGP